MAQVAVDEGWDIDAVLNNDMIGNIQGIDGVHRQHDVPGLLRAVPGHGNGAEELRGYRTSAARSTGLRGSSRGTSTASPNTYFTDLDAIMIYRLDRFGRGGHHRPFNDAGFPAVRIMETHENYDRQHQDLRTENGVAYGDVVAGVDFGYAAKLTAVDAAVLASLAWAPPAPENVRVGGAVQPSTTLEWDAVDDPNLAGYKIYWRDTTAPQWQHARFVGNVTTFTLENLVIDNYLFGVAAVGRDGNESVVSFPTAQIRRR